MRFGESFVPRSKPDDGSSDEQSKATVEVKPEFKFAPQIYFRSADGNFDVLTKENRYLTDEDILQRGFLTNSDKVNLSFARLLDELPAVLHAPGQNMSTERREIVNSLLKRRPTFVPIDVARVDSEFSNAVTKFEGAQLGVILFPETNEIMNQFSGVRFTDGRVARLMRGRVRENLQEFTSQLNMLSPHIEAREIDRKQSAYAVEYMQGAERPKTISPQERDDWLNRVRSSGLIFDFDVSTKDESLDNLMRKDGKLFWVDGNILLAKPAENPEQLEMFIEEQRIVLEKFVKE